MGGAPCAAAAAWLATWTWVPVFLPALLLPVVLRSGAAARFGAPVAGVLVLIAVFSAFAPGPAGAFAAVPNPLGLAWAPWLGPAAGVLIGLTFLVPELGVAQKVAPGTTARITFDAPAGD
ncbi:hypothetical protein [Pseudonocardia sp. NPDC046786]|uniref:hypothetical protein n=1 Tax=Pseudonocardia sp. NPDC046786 TaxID=3155471 RepID=UPI0033DEB504